MRLLRRRVPPAEPTDSVGHGDERLSELLGALPTAVLVVDAAEDLVLANQAAQALRLVEDGALAPRFRPIVRKARQADGPVYADLVIGNPPSEMALHLQASRTRRGQTVLLADDYTDAVRIEAVRRDFVANVSHELKTPVGAVSLLAETIVEARDDPAAVAQFAERLQKEANRLARLVDDLIQLSRVQGGLPGQREPVAVGALITEAVDRNRVAAERKSIAIELPADLAVSLFGDSRQLCTALSNVIENAIAYSPEGGRIGIGLETAGDSVEIVVTDNGVGIPAQEIPRIFERFYRVDPARSRATGGTGLGLAIAKHIVGNHGGAIRVWSEEGKGSTFTLRLPLDREYTP